MTIEAERASSDREAPPGVSGTTVRALVDLVRERRGDAGMAQTLVLAGDRRTFAELADTDTTTDPEAAASLLASAGIVLDDPTVGRQLGERLLDDPHATRFADRLRALRDMEHALRHVGAIIGHFDATADAVALEVADDRALVEVAPSAGTERTVQLCGMAQGLLTSLPTIYGLAPAVVVEDGCSAAGDRRCRYTVSWRDGHVPPPVATTDTEVAGATGAGAGPEPGPGPGPGPADELAALRSLLDGALGLPVDDEGGNPEAVLGALAEEAGRLITSPTYLFLARSAPGAPLRRFSRGLTDDEVARLAPELWRLHPEDTAADGRWVVDVASPRRTYGRLALLPGSGGRVDDVEASVVARFADLAARALDVALLVAETRRSTASTRALLEFSQALSTVADVTGCVQLVADTAPRVVPCDQCTVFLWDEVAGQIVPWARSSTDVEGWSTRLIGAIVPDRSAEPSRRSPVPKWHPRGMAPPPAAVGPAVDATARVEPAEPVGGDGEDGGDDDAEPAPVGGRLPPFRPLLGLRRPLDPSVDTGADPDRTAPAGPAPASDGTGPGEAGDADDDVALWTVRWDTGPVATMITERRPMVLDETTEDPELRRLLDESDTAASVVAPIFAAGEFLGAVAANFADGPLVRTVHDAEVHERLMSLAEHAGTVLQNLELLEQVSHMAWHDALTGLPNRRLFEDRVEQELVRSRRVGEAVCLFFIDLDHFKVLNDSHGHAAGDEVLAQVGERLVATVRSQDTVARVGGDEFAILLPGLVEQDAIEQLAERVLVTLHDPFTVFSQEMGISASVGIAIAPDHGDTYDDLVNHADEAMYGAKESGRNAFRMYDPFATDGPSMRSAFEEQSLFLGMRQAIERDEFFVLYQPTLDLRTHRVVGVEALIRWNHPELGVLGPADFINMAERSDVIVSLDSWVLLETCRQARSWLDRGLPPLRLSVNLASRDIANPDFYLRTRRALDEHGIAPSLLELEITERVVLEQKGPARQNIEDLRKLGVRFSIDDFGSGHSLLSRIGSFPVNTLKIDRSFVLDLGTDDENNELVSAIIAMADRLGLACVAEGVESDVQRDILVQRGCRTAQGFFFSPPLTGEGVEQLIEEVGAGEPN